ncbi:MAG: PA0069 family radical SAM protein [Alphaproteobacteria bacterium]|nr:PA0069 family radical SAM protein [Alphaproteobacteria bacterium]
MYDPTREAAPDALPQRIRKGRGAIGNASGRFEPVTRHPIDDGWGHPFRTREIEPPIKTTVSIDRSRTIIARNTSPDIGFEQSINPYRGCEHGCVYCFARPTHAWLGLSPGLDFESRLFAKPDAPALLRKELSAKSYRCSPIAMGTNTDPYQPIERDYRITRRILAVLSDCGHPVTLVTKSAMVLRDLDILAPMAKRGLVKVCLSVTTLDRGLARRMEPRASTPVRRLEAIAGLKAAGVPVGVMAAPMIPALNDMELERILEAASSAGASEAGYILLRLPLEIKALFADWLQSHFPDKAKHVLSLVRETRGGKLYQSGFGTRMVGQGPYAELLKARFASACRRFGLNERRFDLDTSQFEPPSPNAGQLKLL